MTSLRYSDHRHHLDRLVRAALRAADPAEAVRRHWRASDLEGAERVFVVGAGKGGAAMARATADLVGPRLAAGAVAVPASGLPAPDAAPGGAITLIAAGHPRPDEGSLQAGRAIAALLAGTSERDLVLALISGGGSALLEHPLPGLTLDDLQDLTHHLLRSGAPISELNCVRKHLSQIKGGGLARMAAPARLVALILSDVVGDPLDVIASGPTVPDPTTVAEAQAILHRRGLEGLKKVRSALAETPKPGDRIFGRVANRLIGSNELARRAAAEAARDLGFEAAMPPVTVQGEARDWGTALVRDRLPAERRARGMSERPMALIYGGEPTVTVGGHGVGGRNQELALAAAIALEGASERVVVASFGTDGVDGPTPAAGALAGPDSVPRARALGLDAQAALADNDSHSFFAALGDGIVTGPTGTNVNDLVIVLAYPERKGAPREARRRRRAA